MHNPVSAHGADLLSYLALASHPTLGTMPSRRAGTRENLTTFAPSRPLGTMPTPPRTTAKPPPQYDHCMTGKTSSSAKPPRTTPKPPPQYDQCMTGKPSSSANPPRTTAKPPPQYDHCITGNPRYRPKNHDLHPDRGRNTVAHLRGLHLRAVAAGGFLQDSCLDGFGVGVVPQMAEH